MAPQTDREFFLYCYPAPETCCTPFRRNTLNLMLLYHCITLSYLAAHRGCRLPSFHVLVEQVLQALHGSAWRPCREDCRKRPLKGIDSLFSYHSHPCAMGTTTLTCCCPPLSIRTLAECSRVIFRVEPAAFSRRPLARSARMCHPLPMDRTLSESSQPQPFRSR